MDRGLETRKRVIEAATKMFAERGVAQTTLREVTRAAGVNMAAVNYHFGGKEALANAVFADLSERVNTERRNQIAEVVDRAETEGSRPDLGELIDIFLGPYLNADDPSTAMLLAHLVMLHRVAPSTWTRQIIADQFDGMAQDFVHALHLACPHLSLSEVYWRYYLMPGCVIFSTTDADRGIRLVRLSDGECDPSDWNATRRELRQFLMNAFSGDGIQGISEESCG